ncbi:hypothetical protein KEM55_002875 [Ascosphaera atra]|nr:hypothetical protein KEM55_002875 [Ascosphaera atra]
MNQPVNPFSRPSSAHMSTPLPQPPSPAAFSLISATGHQAGNRSISSGEPSPPIDYHSTGTTLAGADDPDADTSRERLVRAVTPVPADVDTDVELHDLNDNGADLQEQESATSSAGRKRNALSKAQERAKKLASVMRRPSIQRRRLGKESFKLPNLPKILDEELTGTNTHEGPGPSKEADGEDGEDEDYTETLAKKHSQSRRTVEAHQLVQELTRADFPPLARVNSRSDDPSNKGGNMSSPPEEMLTPFDERGGDADYLSRPKHYRGGILSTLLKLYETQRMHEEHQAAQQHQHVERGRKSPTIGTPRRARSPSRPRSAFSPAGWRAHSHNRTPSRPRWYEKNASTSTLPGQNSISTPSSPLVRPGLPRSRSSGTLVGIAKKILPTGHGHGHGHGHHHLPGRHLEDEIRITVHIAETLSRQRYLLKLCRALMLYGAPTHRLEEYMRMSARVLEIDSQYLYIPGCMIVSFDDATTHTTEVRLVRCSQGIELGRLADVHEVYKEVVHDVIGVDEAMTRLDEIMGKPRKYNIYWLTLWYGLAAVFVGPFAFGARPIDTPIAFLLGAILGVLQHYIAPKSDLYQNVFEVSAAILTSFLARAFGSIRNSDGEYLFCFAALAQSSIALILPGYIVLCGSLELQSKNLVAGSVRMVYAILYSLFLGFGILIGTALYGLMDANASSAYQCPATPIKNEYLNKFPSVFGFTICLVLANHGRIRQMPIMAAISVVGYIVNLFSAKRFYYNTQIANTLAALAIGVMGNLYSRLAHGVAAAAILPAIFVQVPSGLAATGSLLSGITIADELTHNHTGTDSTGMTFGEFSGSSRVYGNVVFDLSYGMIQVAIGITVGLFLAALVVYPFGKRRSGLFSF